MQTEEYLKDIQVRRVLDKARHYKLSAEHSTDKEGNFFVTLSGNREALYVASSTAGQAWARNAHVSGDGGKTVWFAWEMEHFVKGKKQSLKPDGSLPDADVFSAIPKWPIETMESLNAICSELCVRIEEAYPGVRIGSSGHGKGKALLVGEVVNRLLSSGVISRQIQVRPWDVIRRLVQHIQLKHGETLEVAGAKRPQGT